MSAPRNRADELTEAWTNATARPVPAFAPRASRRRSMTAAAVIISIVVIVGTVVGALAIGGYLRRPVKLDNPADIATSVAQAIATAPGVRYSLVIATHYEDGTLRLDASGEIDFQGGRFSGTADGGGGGAMMQLFGGPSNGAVVIADGLFVQTDGGPWVKVDGQGTALDKLLDPAALSNAIKGAIDASEIDPVDRSGRCGSATCRIVRLSIPAGALIDVEEALLESGHQPPPPDLGPTTVDLFVDPSSGFPARMTTQIVAGTTTTVVTLDLTRLDPAPTISAPIP